MKSIFFITIGALLGVLCLTSPVFGSCKNGEGDPYAPHPSPQTNIRLRTFTPPSASPDSSNHGGTSLEVIQYNIQSGLSLGCVYNLEAQTNILRTANYFGLQEVDMFNDLRCMCSQPSVIANKTGHTVLYLTTILYRTGFYGSALGTSVQILESRYYMFKNYYGEERGLTAIRTQPPQLGGRTLWFINTHFQFDGEYWRQLQASEVVAYVQGLVQENPAALIVVSGDFYIVPGLGSYSTMEAYLQNAWSVFHGSSDGGFTYPSNYPTNRFDHIWFKFPSGTKYTLNVEVVQSLLSDHLPIRAVFNFNPTSGSTGSCLTQISYRIRDGSTTLVNSGRGIAVTVDLTVTNTGSVPAKRIYFDIVLPGNSIIASWWQFARPAPTYMDLPNLQPGASYSLAGYQLEIPDSTTLQYPGLAYRSSVC